MLVEAVKDMKKIKLMLAFTKAENIKEYALLKFGFNTGLRISDILSLAWEDIQNSRIRISEQKTNLRPENHSTC